MHRDQFNGFEIGLFINKMNSRTKMVDWELVNNLLEEHWITMLQQLKLRIIQMVMQTTSS